jgi:hypothetical protein
MPSIRTPDPACPACRGTGWVCEAHPDKPGDHVGRARRLPLRRPGDTLRSLLPGDAGRAAAVAGEARSA